jgi:type IV pilus assembly protein PilZ
MKDQTGMQERPPRAPLQLRVDYTRMNMFFADYTKNISKGGTFIRTATPLPVGTRFVFRLGIPGFSEPIELGGEVAWCVEAPATLDDDREPGMGIRFLFRDDAQKQWLETVVEKLMIESLGEDIYRQLLGKES